MSNLSPENRSSVYARARRLVPLAGTASLLAASLNSPVEAQSTPCRPTIVLTDQVSGSFRAEQLVSPNTYRPVSDIATGDGRNNIVIQIDSRATVSEIVMSAGVKRLGVDGIEVRDFTTGEYVRHDKQPLDAKIPCEGARITINKTQQAPATPKATPTPEIRVVTATATSSPVNSPTPEIRVVTTTPTLEPTKTHTPFVVTATPTIGPVLPPDFYDHYRAWESLSCLAFPALVLGGLGAAYVISKK